MIIKNWSVINSGQTLFPYTLNNMPRIHECSSNITERWLEIRYNFFMN
jgi:hypothetical protein